LDTLTTKIGTDIDYNTITNTLSLFTPGNYELTVSMPFMRISDLIPPSVRIGWLMYKDGLEFLNIFPSGIPISPTDGYITNFSITNVVLVPSDGASYTLKLVFPYDIPTVKIGNSAYQPFESTPCVLVKKL
jgi:hypothetical protein